MYLFSKRGNVEVPTNAISFFLQNNMDEQWYVSGVHAQGVYHQVYIPIRFSAVPRLCEIVCLKSVHKDFVENIGVSTGNPYKTN